MDQKPTQICTIVILMERFSRKIDFWSASEGIKKLEIILYHDDFNVVNPLRNKTGKYKVSAFYFVLGNLPAT